MKNLSIALYVLSIASLVFGVLGALGYVAYNFYAAVFLYFLFKEASEFAMLLAVSAEINDMDM